jgi:orotate phosphoribosyltransferase
MTAKNKNKNINIRGITMLKYKCDFIELMLGCGVLTFGDFTLKSGRRSPYFINTGKYRTGGQLSALGGFYADCIAAAVGEDELCRSDNGLLLFGPAYKGIPLAAAASCALYQKYNAELRYCFNRKEIKDHGEGGAFVGSVAQDGDRIIIVEDVITAGTAVRETVPLLQAAAKAEIPYMIISVDRKERTASGMTASDEVNDEFGIKVFSIVTVSEIREYINGKFDADLLSRMDKYIGDYCVK